MRHQRSRLLELNLEAVPETSPRFHFDFPFRLCPVSQESLPVFRWWAAALVGRRAQQELDPATAVVSVEVLVEASVEVSVEALAPVLVVVSD